MEWGGGGGDGLWSGVGVEMVCGVGWWWLR